MTNASTINPITDSSLLCFRQITAADYGRLTHYMELTDSRTCDYTLGGVVLWAGLFDYTIAEKNDTLFIRGGREDNLSVPAYSLPLGSGNFGEAIAGLRQSEGSPIWFSAIPEDRLHLFSNMQGRVLPLGAEWSDYLYDINQFDTLEGNAMKKKRNHVNRFTNDHPEARLMDMTPALALKCLGLLTVLGHDGTATGRAEHLAAAQMLIRWKDFAPYFRGGVLIDGDGRVMGFTVGEIKFDTLHVHIEKMDHSVNGAGETLAHLFAKRTHALYPRLMFVNRQDDAGDSGLRAAKESWHPLRLLPKYNVLIK